MVEGVDSIYGRELESLTARGEILFVFRGIFLGNGSSWGEERKMYIQRQAAERGKNEYLSNF